MASENKVSILIIALCFSLFASGIRAHAFGKTTVDPNVSSNNEVQAEEESFWKSDNRLLQQVSYRAKRQPVRVILADLGKLSGVKLQAGFNSKDWQVRDRRMTIVANELSLGDLMQSVARVMKLGWTRSKEDDIYTYRLLMDRRMLLDAEGQKAREEEKYYEEQGNKRHKLISDVQKISDLSEQELENLKTENPYLYGLSAMGIGDAFKAFMSEQLIDLQSMAPNSMIRLDGSTLSPAGQEILRHAALKAAQYHARSSGNPPLTQDELSAITGTPELVLRSHMSLDNASDFGFYLSNLGEAGIILDGIVLSCAFLRDPSLRLAQSEGKAMVRCLEGTDFGLAWDEEVAKDREKISSELNSKPCLAISEQKIEHEDDPALHVEAEVKLDEEYVYLEGIQVTLADAFGISLVSDSFGGVTLSPVFSGKTELRKALDTISNEYRYNWWHRSDLLEFRDRRWFRKRSAQLPDEWLDSWRSALKKDSYLDIDYLAQIAMLSYEQFTWNLASDKDLGSYKLGLSTLSNSGILMLYAALNKDQRARLFTTSGLDLKTLSPEQYVRAEKLVGDILSNSDDEIFLTAQRAQKANGNPLYKFRITVAGEPQSPEWTVESRSYNDGPE